LSTPASRRWQARAQSQRRQSRERGAKFSRFRQAQDFEQHGCAGHGQQRQVADFGQVRGRQRQTGGGSQPDTRRVRAQQFHQANERRAKTQRR